MTSYKGINYLRQKLKNHQPRVLLRYKYYDLKNQVKDFGISTPPKLRNWQSCLGWCATSVDSIADRLSFRQFQNDDLNFNEILSYNNKDVLIDSAIIEALIASCSFIYISKGEDGRPRLQVLTAENATGCIDPLTNMLTEGYAVLERNTQGQPITEAYFTKEMTVIYEMGKQQPMIINNPAPYPLLVPIINRPSSKRPFGRSRISRSQMDIVGSACRTMKRSEISSEFYSFPQKYITNLSQDAEISDKWDLAMQAFLALEKDEDGDSPKVGNFSQQSMSPHIDHFKMLAMAFAGDADLTPDDLGIATNNPASSDAIKASHEKLRLKARKAQDHFGTGFKNALFLAACVRDNFSYNRDEIENVKLRWKSIFEPDVNALSGLGDAIIKIQQAVPGYLTEDKIEDLLGF